MLPSRFTRSLTLNVLCVATALALIGGLISCSSSDDIPGTTTTNFYGVYTEPSGAPGTISLSGLSVAASTRARVQGTSPNAVALAGTLNIAGQAPINISGFYDPDSGVISFSSDDSQYNFSGQVLLGQATGIAFGPGGQGSFVLFLGGTSASVPTYCGTVLCTTPVDCSATGSFNVVVAGSVALMTANYNGLAGVGAGTGSATAVDFHIVQQSVDITIHGDITGSAISGTWTDNNNGYAGTWNGSTSQCTAAPTSLRKMR